MKVGYFYQLLNSATITLTKNLIFNHPSYRMNGIWGKWNIWKNWKSSTKYLEGLHVYFQLFRRRLISDEILQMFNVNIASKTYVKLKIWNILRLLENFHWRCWQKWRHLSATIKNINNIDLVINIDAVLYVILTGFCIKITTETIYKIGTGSWALCFILSFIGCWPCNFISCFFKEFKDVLHKCPQCEKKVFYSSYL